MYLQYPVVIQKHPPNYASFTVKRKSINSSRLGRQKMVNLAKQKNRKNRETMNNAKPEVITGLILVFNGLRRTNV